MTFLQDRCSYLRPACYCISPRAVYRSSLQRNTIESNILRLNRTTSHRKLIDAHSKKCYNVWFFIFRSQGYRDIGCAQLEASIYELPVWCYGMGEESSNNKPAHTWLNVFRHECVAIIYQLFHITKVSVVASRYGLDRHTHRLEGSQLFWEATITATCRDAIVWRYPESSDGKSIMPRLSAVGASLHRPLLYGVWCLYESSSCNPCRSC